MSRPLYSVAGGAIRGPSGPLLAGLELDVRENAVTVLLGPGGSGKSTLLRVLSGHRLADGWSVCGSWRYRGRALRGLPVRLVGQRPAGGASPSAVEEALESGAETVLLDEPPVPSEDRRLFLAARIQAHAGRGSVVVVTHDVAFARSVADDVVLLCGGGVGASGSSPRFFDSPPNSLAEKFVAQGNCCVGTSRPPRLPSHFRWVRPGRLAGMARPGLLGDVDEDLLAISEAGISVLVSLTPDAVPQSHLSLFGLEGRHLPIPDMGVPSVARALSTVRSIASAMHAGRAVAVHCQAGQGRTGLILASVLAWEGLGPREAIEAARVVSRGYIQSQAQADFVHRFADAASAEPESSRQTTVPEA